MTFKRVRVWPGRRNVNAAAASALLFFAAACSRGADPEPEAVETPEPPAASGVELPAVWATAALDKPIREAALGGGGEPFLALAYEGGGLQMFNLDADRISPVADYDVLALAEGQPAEIDGAAFTLFPAATAEGGLAGYIFGGQLDAPAEIALPGADGVTVAGVCAGPAVQPEALFRLAYWTEDAPEILLQGLTGVEDGVFTWRALEAYASPSEIADCTLTGTAAIVAHDGGVVWIENSEPSALEGSENLAQTAWLDTANGDYVVARTPAGRLKIAEAGGGFRALSVRDGITMAAPPSTRAIAALGQPRFGGYPGGLIVLAGETAQGHQAVFVDTAALRPEAAEDAPAN
ncbi:MAG: hypothetical protein AAFX03_03720 [Pseudomonadota bacterium]